MARIDFKPDDVHECIACGIPNHWFFGELIPDSVRMSKMGEITTLPTTR